MTKSLKILLTEQNRLYTEDYILPMGLLRDTRSSALKADIIIVTKCDDIDQQKMDEILGDHPGFLLRFRPTPP